MNIDQLVTKVKKEHEQVVKAVQKSLEHARNAGEYLLDIKLQLEGTTHDFKKWVPANCKFSYRTASTYIRIHENWSKLEKADTSALSIRGADALLSEGTGQKKPPKPKLTKSRLAELMEHHGIHGDPEKLLALLNEAGVKLKLADEEAAEEEEADEETEAATA